MPYSETQDENIYGQPRQEVLQEHTSYHDKYHSSSVCALHVVYSHTGPTFTRCPNVTGELQPRLLFHQDSCNEHFQQCEREKRKASQPVHLTPPHTSRAADGLTNCATTSRERRESTQHTQSICNTSITMDTNDTARNAVQNHRGSGDGVEACEVICSLSYEDFTLCTGSLARKCGSVVNSQKQIGHRWNRHANEHP